MMFNKNRDDAQAGSTPNPTPSNPQSNPPSAPSSPTATAAPSGGSASTLLAEGCSFEGNADVSGTLRVEGVLEGEIAASDNVVVGKTGDVQADVKTRRAVLNGKFQGKINAEDTVELQSGSRVTADVQARNMVMEDGVQFEGNIKIGK